MSNFTVYKSSAGSGKTFTLIKEYLKLILSENNTSSFRNILAITFTNKASAEMKVRIVDTLFSFSNTDKLYGTAKIMIGVLAEELNMTSAQIQKKAAIILPQLLYNYNDFSVQTIDQFTHRIIKTFAFDLKIPLQFEVEMDADYLLQLAVDNLIDRLGRDALLTPVILDFALDKLDDEKNWHIDDEIFTFSKIILEEKSFKHLKELKSKSFSDFQKTRRLIKTKTTVIANLIKNIGAKALDLLAENKINPISLAGGKNGVGKYFINLREFNYAKLNTPKALEKALDSNAWAAGKATTIEKIAIENCSVQLAILAAEAIQAWKANRQEFLTYNLVHKNIYQLSLLNEVSKEIEKIKEDEQKIHISEFNKKISEIVSEQPVPFIYERIGEKYQHYLIDEFQDTSVLQWQNLLPLVENSLAYGNYNLIVGDGKQSIYRWRGGEVEQFSKLPRAIDSSNEINNQRHDTLIRNFEEHNLKNNFRSKREIIEFNNYFFKHICEKLGDKQAVVYDDFEQYFNEKNTGGYVQIENIGKEIEPGYVLEKTLLRTLEIIKVQLEQGFSFSDITILARTNKEASLIANYLVENNIDIVSSESLRVSESEEVSFIINLLKYCENHYDLEAVVGVANYIYKEIDDSINISEKFNLFKTNPFALGNWLKQYYPDFNSFKINSLTIYEAIEKLLYICKLDGNKSAHIPFFMETVYRFYESKSTNITDFLEFWSRKSNNEFIKSSESTDAVTIITIHKSKGLEFPIVIFPFANWLIKAGSRNLWVNTKTLNIGIDAAVIDTSKALENTIYEPKYRQEMQKTLLETINLLYVTFTRAEKRLYVITNQSPMKNLGAYFLPFLKESPFWNEDKQKYCLGSELIDYQDVIEKPVTDTLKLSEYYSHNWQSTISIAATGALHWDGRSEERDWGTKLHYLLSLIYTNKDIELALQSLIVNPNEFAEVKATLHQIVEHPDISEYYKEGVVVKNEQELIVKNDEILRPDRVVFANDIIVIIDYKTGLYDYKHEQQIVAYADVISDLNKQVVKKYLVYIGSKVEVQEVL